MPYSRTQIEENRLSKVPLSRAKTARHRPIAKNMSEASFDSSYTARSTSAANSARSCLKSKTIWIGLLELPFWL